MPRARLTRGAACLAVATLALAPLVACSGDGTGPSDRDLVGVWGALRFEYTSAAQPPLSRDIVQDDGASYTIDFTLEGTYTTRLSEQSGTTRDAGTFDIRGSTLVLVSNDGPRVEYEQSLENGFMTLRRQDAAFDFDSDGTPEPASLFIRLQHF